MTPSAIVSPAPVAQAEKPAAKPNAAASTDTSFSQTLSQEVANRANEPAADADGNSAQKLPAPAATNTSKSAEPKAAKSGGKEKSASSDEDDDKKTADIPATAPADLIALVSDAARLSKAVDTSKAAPSATEDTAAGTDKTSKKSAVAIGAAAARDAQHRLQAGPDGGPDAQPQATVDSTRAGMPDAKHLPDAATGKTAALQAAEQASNRFAGALAAKTTDSTLPSAAPMALQGPAMNAVHELTAPAGDRLAPQVGTPGWDQALGQKVILMVGGGEQSASLTLNPPDLGPLQVVLHVSNSQADATFTAAQPEVRQALESAMPKLREMLGDAGIQLGQATVNAGTPGQQQGNGQTPSRHADRGYRPSDNDAIAPVAARPTIIRRDGLVDTFV